MKVTGVMHMHSTFSYDGKVTLGELKTLLQRNGISFCCMTEHTDEMTPGDASAFIKKCRELSDEKFVFVPGFEVPYKNTHVLQIGATQFLGQKADGESLKKWREISPLVVLAHPVRNRFKIDEELQNLIDGVEVWNQQYEGKRAPRFRSLMMHSKIKKLRSGLLATSGLDLHRVEHFGSPILELEVDELNEETIVKAIHFGNYVSQSSDTVIDARGRFIKGGGFPTRLQSTISICVINLGKFTNRTLAALGLKLPKRLLKSVRQRV